ncbi:MAG TPA: DEAD/DEAH box helicase [Myxococcota bacterium]|nr:DEAD/DEAH box helicase [Myxococcota bacterium]HNZ03267.1 DEAD/DEAH box helicase [Myxococcota bacterium]HPB50839.1 DEAD/DEAH box helicase [Myxococcota bacterium]HQP95831.1 DEAD/DEAH box helicase [Myxococcota bacterium]
MEKERTEVGFADMELPEPVMKALTELGWETPTPIQAATIPRMLAGSDIVGQAQTGTGKTAAFALPIMSRIDVSSRDTQALILTPTRELCIQVAQVLTDLAAGMKGFKVLAVYGGQGFAEQLVALKHGVQVVVGTPGRVMDHMRRKTLKLDALSMLVLDEADEMLHMGFIEDVEWILEQTPSDRQIALFSATMPPEIRRIARKHLNDPEEIMISTANTTADNIVHRYWITQNPNKFEVLARILETEEHDGVLIFSRTKSGTIEIAERLCEAGIPAASLNGDMKQVERERTVDRFKDGKMDVLVATDVAARGLDVDRISHVINYDPPHDTEGYVHRVGRTGRAGRSGTTIIIATPRERRFLAEIERSTGLTLLPYEMPTLENMNRKRIEKFKDGIARALRDDGCGQFAGVISEFIEETGVPAVNVAAALARVIQGSTPLTLDSMPGSWTPTRYSRAEPASRPGRGQRPERSGATGRRAAAGDGYGSRDDSGRGSTGRAPSSAPVIKPRSSRRPEDGMDRYRVECGYVHGVMPGNIVGAIANEAGLRGSDIGHIEIFDEYSTVDLPTGMPDDIYAILKRAKILNRALSLSLIHQAHQESYETRERPRDYPRAKVGGSGDLPPRRPRPDRPASRKPSKAPRRRG